MLLVPARAQPYFSRSVVWEPAPTAPVDARWFKTHMVKCQHPKCNADSILNKAIMYVEGFGVVCNRTPHIMDAQDIGFDFQELQRNQRLAVAYSRHLEKVVEKGAEAAFDTIAATERVQELNEELTEVQEAAEQANTAVNSMLNSMSRSRPNSQATSRASTPNS